MFVEVQSLGNQSTGYARIFLNKMELTLNNPIKGILIAQINEVTGEYMEHIFFDSVTDSSF